MTETWTPDDRFATKQRPPDWLESLPSESVSVDIDPIVLAEGVRSRRGRPQNRTEVF